MITDPKDSCKLCICKDGSLLCSTKCSENKHTCLSKQEHDSDHTYHWIPAQPGECCGKCNKTRGIEKKFCFSFLLIEFYLFFNLKLKVNVVLNSYNQNLLKLVNVYHIHKYVVNDVLVVVNLKQVIF